MTVITSPARTMPTPDLRGFDAQVADLDASICECDREALAVVHASWMTGEFNCPNSMGRDALENGPEYVLDRSTVEKVDVQCCAWCYSEVLEDAESEALEDTLVVQVSRVWLSIAGVEVAA